MSYKVHSLHVHAGDGGDRQPTPTLEEQLNALPSDERVVSMVIAKQGANHGGAYDWTTWIVTTEVTPPVIARYLPPITSDKMVEHDLMGMRYEIDSDLIDIDAIAKAFPREEYERLFRSRTEVHHGTVTGRVVYHRGRQLLRMATVEELSLELWSVNSGNGTKMTWAEAIERGSPWVEGCRAHAQHIHDYLLRSNR